MNGRECTSAMGDSTSDGSEGLLVQVHGPTTPYKESTGAKVAFLVSLTFMSMMAGVGIKLGLAGRRYRSSLRTKPGEVCHEDPVLLAARALGWGTLFAVAGTGGLVLAGTGVWALVSRSVCLLYRFKQRGSRH